MNVSQEVGLEFGPPDIEGRYNGRKLVFKNPQAVTDLLGYVAEDWNSFVFPFDSIPTQDRRFFMAALQRLKANPGSIETVVFRIFPKQERSYRYLEFISRYRVSGPQPRWFDFKARDITDQVRRETQITRRAKTDGVQLAARTMVHTLHGHFITAIEYSRGLTTSTEVPTQQRAVVKEVNDSVIAIRDRMLALMMVIDPIETDLELPDGNRVTIIDLDNSKLNGHQAT